MAGVAEFVSVLASLIGHDLISYCFPPFGLVLALALALVVYRPGQSH